MYYKRIFQFIAKCKDLLKRTPRNEQEHYRVFMFSALGRAVWLELYAQRDIILKEPSRLCWILSSTAQGYKIEHCMHCSGENPCKNHQVSPVTPLNLEIIRQANRANEPEIGLSVTVPEPIYPMVKKGFDSLQEFREATKDIFPKFSERSEWSFPSLEDGLHWNLEKIEYPKVIGYSPDGMTEYERGFYKVEDGEFLLLSRLNELLPRGPGAYLLRPILIRRLLILQQIYRNGNKIRRDLADKLDAKMKEAELAKERRELAKKFGVEVKNG